MFFVRCKSCLVHAAVTFEANYPILPDSRATVHCGLMDKITGIHAVREALEAGRPLEHILIAKGRQDTRVEEILQLARRQGVPVRFEERTQLDRSASTNQPSCGTA